MFKFVAIFRLQSSATLSRVAPLILREEGKAKIIDEERAKEAARSRAQAEAVERAAEVSRPAITAGAGTASAGGDAPATSLAANPAAGAGALTSTTDETTMSIEDRAELTAKQLERIGARRFLQWAAVAALMDTEAPVTVGVCPRIGNAAEAAAGVDGLTRGAAKAAERRDNGAKAVLQRMAAALLANPLEDRQPESVHLLVYALQLARRPIEALKVLNGPINRRASLERRYVPMVLPAETDGSEGAAAGAGAGGEGKGKG